MLVVPFMTCFFFFIIFIVVVSVCINKVLILVLCFQLQEYLNNLGGQMAEPQRIAAVQSVHASGTTSCNDEFSPIMPNKAQRKYYLGSRSPSGQSPVTKSRKTPQNVNLTAPSASATALFGKDNNSDKETGSPKQKSWKNFVTNQFKKIQSTSDSASHDTVPEGASIGVPLAHCPPVIIF